MNGNTLRWLASAVLLLLAGSALAQSSPNHRLEWSTTSGIGSTASSAHYNVQGTLGTSLGDDPPTSTSFRVQDGFWIGFSDGGPIYEQWIYLPLVTRGFH